MALFAWFSIFDKNADFGQTLFQSFSAIFCEFSLSMQAKKTLRPIYSFFRAWVYEQFYLKEQHVLTSHCFFLQQVLL